MYLPAANTLGFSTNGAIKLLINSHGDLSTNTSSLMTSPWKSFEIGTDVGTMVLAGRTDGVNQLILGTNWTYDGGVAQEFLGSAYSSQYFQQDGNHILRSSSASGSAGADITYNEIARFTKEGNVGIGTTSPTAKLHVDGTGRFTGSITSTAVNAIISTGGSSILSSQYTGTNGNWFTFQNAGGVHYVGIDNSAGTDFGATAYSMLFYTPSTRNIEFLSPAGKRMVIASGGAVTINNLAGINDVGADANGKLQAATSDINLKNTIEDSPFGLNEILLLNPVTFLYNDINRKIDSDVKEVGFIAQDVFDIIPNAVSSIANGDLQLDYRAITATLVKAIQEQQALIKALEQRILTLENK